MSLIGETAGKPGANGSGFIQRSIIDDDNFNLGAGRPGALDRARQELRPIAGGNDDAYRGHVD